MSTTNNASNVTTGKPAVTGAAYRAPKGTSLPANATAALAAAYKPLGYISEDGMKNKNEIESSEVKAWGGDVVMNITKGRKDSFQFKMIESMNTEVIKSVFGDGNVTVSSATGIAIAVNSADMGEYVWVLETVLRGGRLKRIVIPCGQVTAVGDIEYKDDDAVGYDVTISASADTSGNTHYEYISPEPTDPDPEGGTE